MALTDWLVKEFDYFMAIAGQFVICINNISNHEVK